MSSVYKLVQIFLFGFCNILVYKWLQFTHTKEILRHFGYPFFQEVFQEVLWL